MCAKQCASSHDDPSFPIRIHMLDILSSQEDLGQSLTRDRSKMIPELN